MFFFCVGDMPSRKFFYQQHVGPIRGSDLSPTTHLVWTADNVWSVLWFYLPTALSNIVSVAFYTIETILYYYTVGYQRADERHGNPPQGNQELLVVRDKVGRPPRWAWGKQVHGMWYFSPSVLRHCWLGDRKGIRPVKNWMLVCWWWWFDWSFAWLIAPVVQLSPPPPSSYASINTG